MARSHEIFIFIIICELTAYINYYLLKYLKCYIGILYVLVVGGVDGIDDSFSSDVVGGVDAIGECSSFDDFVPGVLWSRYLKYYIEILCWMET